MKPTLDRIAAAVEQAGSRTPSVVLNALLPEPPTVFGMRLRKFSLGSYLALEKLGHPFVVAAAGGRVDVTTHDAAAALYVLTTPSADVFAAIAAGTVADEILATADRADMEDLKSSVSLLMSHIERGLEPSMPMRSASGGSQKKTADSVGH